MGTLWGPGSAQLPLWAWTMSLVQALWYLSVKGGSRILTAAWICFMIHCLRPIVPMFKGHSTNNRSSPSPLSGLKQLLNLYPFVYKHQHRHPSRLTSEDPSSIHIPIFAPLLTFVQRGMAMLLPICTHKSHPALSSWFSSHKSYTELYSSLSPR